jgi:hypothetical protein
MSATEQGGEGQLPLEQVSVPTVPTAPPPREAPGPVSQGAVAEAAPDVTAGAERPARRRLLYVTLPGC